ncbi:MAG: ribose-phosphate pyrophosphokinase [Candidatus Peribacter sp.]|nr:ribose-phosphate pyrophosphokinase [Candidatus Peribacter sp.]MBT4392751.1 ribose-phosphate pyrophosphokinase [Candidatus Peribacter sp.]MBT4600632.1 ribose-phosphate pyrophosphokinase [Candidatus Peribacter sp.]MBT5148699.1 ribose-phosphate pyrophosphokinase [Candidatus Peribacter sp.]MBT5637706.1 ribose-phosphate pyrophosphokinase [Candidatus Peribacter sp.]
MHLFAGSSHRELAEGIAKLLGKTVSDVTLKTFSCGERYVKYEESIRGQDVFIVQTATQNVNEDLVELFLMCQAAKLSFAKSVHVIAPFFPYSRQDRVAEYREPISAKLIAHLLEQAGADHVITLNLHSDQIQGFFSIPVDALEAQAIFAKYINQKKIDNPVVVSPDAGGAKRAKKFADRIGADLAIMHKTRPEHGKAEILELVGDIEGRTCILFDDMIDTAGSLISAKDALIDAGANPDVYAIATHPVFSYPAIERLKDAKFKEVIVSNSIPTDANAFEGLTILPIAPLLAQVIENVEKGLSVTEIYDK